MLLFSVKSYIEVKQTEVKFTKQIKFPHVDGLMQDYGNSITNASRAKPLICVL